MKKRTFGFILFIALTLALASCSKTTNLSSSTSSTQSATKTVAVKNAQKSDTNTYGLYEAEDYEDSYDEESATKITFKNTKATIDGTGATDEDGTLSITSGGTYILTGNYEGQVLINASDETVHLILNNVTIQNTSSSAIYVEQAQKVITTLAAQSKNSLSDGTNYSYEATDQTEPDAAFFSKDDLTINGEGSLEVIGNYNNGIRSKDNLVITDGQVKVTAKNNALKGKDSVSIAGGTFTLTTKEGDAIQANNSTDTEKGWVAIDGGTFKIQAGNDGIQAETNLSISTANMDITTAKGYSDQPIDTTQSYKGLKAGGNLVIDKGTYTVNTADDALHANATVTINDGTLNLSSGDDGMHADTELIINKGTIAVLHSYEGLEGATVTINNGDISVLSTDDGVNAAGGNSETETENGQFGADTFSEPNAGGDSSKYIEINGGTIYVDAAGDGLDSNGDIRMTAGTVVVNGPTDDGNGALDYDGTFTMDGGTFVASGSSGMAMSSSDGSSQAALSLYFTTTQKAGTLLHLKNTDGETILTYKAAKDFTHVTISSPNLVVGETITVTSGGEDSGTEKNGLYTGGTYTDGTDLGQIDLTSLQTSVDETGAVVDSSQMGGPGGQSPR